MKDKIEAIQASKYKACIVIAGGGTSAAQAILAHPGASRFVLDVSIPYSTKAFENYLIPERFEGSFCSEAAAVELAKSAYDQAIYYAPNEEVVGISCTAAIKTSRVRRGSDRAFVTIYSPKFTRTATFSLTGSDRTEQEAELGELVINFIHETLV